MVGRLGGYGWATTHPEGTTMADESTIDNRVGEAIELAQAARDRAYSPYSDFPMGAAAVDEAGRSVSGALVENVSLGLAMCAERVALFSAVNDRVKPVVLALASRRTGDEMTFPCGACLQVALELTGPDLLVVAVDPDGASDRARLGDLITRAPQRHHFEPGGPE